MLMYIGGVIGLRVQTIWGCGLCDLCELWVCELCGLYAGLRGVHLVKVWTLRV